MTLNLLLDRSLRGTPGAPLETGGVLKTHFCPFQFHNGHTRHVESRDIHLV